MQRRRPIKQTISLHHTLAAFAKTACELADALPPGPERDALLEEGTAGRHRLSSPRSARLDWIAAADEVAHAARGLGLLSPSDLADRFDRCHAVERLRALRRPIGASTAALSAT
jgi:hypothetical protein